MRAGAVRRIVLLATALVPAGPARAEVYQKLGIPTVATVRWTADQVIRRLLPEGMLSEWRDPSGKIVLAEVAVSPEWVGTKVTALEEATGSRVALITRLGDGMLPDAQTLVQEGDLVHFALEHTRIHEVTAVCARGPKPGDD